jgi:hypothetical protein
MNVLLSIKSHGIITTKFNHNMRILLTNLMSRLMGNTIGLDDNYNSRSQSEVLEEYLTL